MLVERQRQMRGELKARRRWGTTSCVKVHRENQNRTENRVVPIKNKSMETKSIETKSLVTKPYCPN